MDKLAIYAERIVAAVNACHGVPTSELKRLRARETVTAVNRYLSNMIAEKGNVFGRTILGLLNEALSLDPLWVNRVFGSFTFCNRKLAEHRHFICLDRKANGEEKSDNCRFEMGAMGFINGILSQTKQNIIVAKYEEDGSVSQFGFWTTLRKAISSNSLSLRASVNRGFTDE